MLLLSVNSLLLIGHITAAMPLSRIAVLAPGSRHSALVRKRRRSVGEGIHGLWLRSTGGGLWDAVHIDISSVNPATQPQHFKARESGDVDFSCLLLLIVI
jgi:hypothetical protein